LSGCIEFEDGSLAPSRDSKPHAKGRAPLSKQSYSSSLDAKVRSLVNGEVPRTKSADGIRQESDRRPLFSPWHGNDDVSPNAKTERLRRLKLELQAIKVWNKLYNNHDDSTVARQMRRQEIAHELREAKGSKGR